MPSGRRAAEPGRLGHWFLDAHGDLREGGTFQLRDNAHGTILRCQPPRLLRLTWEYGDRAVDEVELRLARSMAGRCSKLSTQRLRGLWTGRVKCWTCSPT